VGLVTVLWQMVCTQLAISAFPLVFSRDIALILGCYVAQQVVLDILALYSLQEIWFLGIAIIPLYMLWYQTILEEDMEIFYLGNLIGLAGVYLLESLGSVIFLVCAKLE